MKRTILFLLLSTVSLFAGVPWPGVQFTEVRAYAWPANMETEAVILPGMALKPGVIHKDGALLSPEQVIRLRAAVTGSFPPHDIRGCYSPCNAFVFYDAAKKPVAYIEISFSCLRHIAAPKPTSRRFGLLEFAKLFDEAKLPMGEFPDFAAFKEFFRDRSL